MPRTNNVSVQNSFIKGLITEATGLTFPENACTDTNNCEFEVTGLVRRRYGFDFEDLNETYTQSLTGNAVVSYVWNNVAGEGDLSFVVIQIGDFLHFYRVSEQNPLSANKHASTIDMSAFFPAGVTTASTLECQFASGNGLLFVTNQRLDSFYVTYDVDLDTFTATEIDIRIRDFEGDTTDTLAIDERQTTDLAGMSSAHEYNLLNQGWTATTLGAWDTARTDMPSNSDVSWYFKNATEAFDFSTVDDRVVGNSPAPKGHYIYSAYNIARSSIVAGAQNEVVDLDRVTTCAFFAGRVFYSGLKAPKYNSRIFFSQIVERADQYGKCYQTNDPTSEELFDLLPSDGGVIDLIEAGSIIKMVPVLNALIIFTYNGIWAITGSQGTGFTANDYTVSKLSSIRNISHTSFVSVEGLPFWWTLDGIYTITVDPQTNAFKVLSLTDSTIRSFYADILAESKETVRGAYSPIEKKIIWIYKSEASNSFESKYQYDRLLNFNLLSQAFYPWSVDDSEVKISAIINVYGLSGIYETVGVVDGVDTVVDGANTVIAFTTSGAGTTSVIKYFVSYMDGANSVVSIAENLENTYVDWPTQIPGGVEYDSFFVTGYMLHGQAIRKFQTNYVNIYSDTSEEDSSFKIQSQWDFATSDASGRWSTEQIYFLTSGDFAFKTKRPKLRGHGKVCQFRVTNNSTYPFNIIGWSAWETANRMP